MKNKSNNKENDWKKVNTNENWSIIGDAAIASLGQKTWSHQWLFSSKSRWEENPYYYKIVI
jgi:hypothetical protein